MHFVANELIAITVILNKSCTLILGAPLKLNKGFVKSIGPEEIGYLIAKKTPFSDYIDSNYKAYFREIPKDYDHKMLNIQNEALAFALNLVSEDNCLLIGETHVFRVGKKKVLDVQLPASNAITFDKMKSEKFKLPKTVNPAQIEKVYNVCVEAIAESQTFLLTLSRFNSSQTKTGLIDKVIDLAISLESVISVQSEVSFQFSLINAILAEDEETKREEIFRLLKNFYNARSAIVHGNITAKSKLPSDKDMARISSIAKLSILRKAMFLSEGGTAASWKKKQISMIFDGY